MNHRSAPDALWGPEPVGTTLSAERELTPAELAEAVAAFLRERVPPGNRVLLLCPPGADYLAAFLGCLTAGVVAVPLSELPEAPLDRIAAVARDCQATVALTV